jgi:hypothetical protein
MAFPAAVIPPESSSTSSADDRRAHVRLSAADLPWIRLSRLRNGPAVALLDLSVGGALLEADVPLRPGSRLTLEIAGHAGEEPALAPMRVLRCEIAALDHVTARYRGACEFVRPLELPALMPKPAPEPPAAPRFMALDVSLKMLAERYRRDPGGSLAVPDVVRVLRLLESRATSTDSDWLARPLADLLPAVAGALEQRADPTSVRATIESRLRLALPQVDVRLTDGPLPPTGSGAEMILFRPDQLSDRGCVLNVELPQGSTLDDWQFRLLRASMHLCSLLDDGPPEGGAPQSTDTPLQRVVARYTNGRVFKGFCRDFTPSQPHFTVWPAPTASADERVMLPFNGLKAVFFVRDLGGDSAYVEEKTFEQPSHGRRVEVTFHDDEVVVGTTLGYRADAQSFFLSPVDPRSNNLRVFIVMSAVRHVRFLGNVGDPVRGRVEEFVPA